MLEFQTDESKQLNVQLTPIEWTEGIVVTKIEVAPAVLYLGETATIEVHFDYYPYYPSMPETIHASVFIDSTKLSGDFSNLIYTKVAFQFTPAMIGDFLVTAQDKSASLTVLQHMPGIVYSPFGGTRMPLCTDIVIPDVEPFSEVLRFPDCHPTYEHLGGDLRWSDLTQFSTLYPHRVGMFHFLFPLDIPQIVDHFLDAQPAAWSPIDATVADWAGAYYERFLGSSAPGIIILATEYVCKEYWESKDEFAKVIASCSSIPSKYIPPEWVTKYGVDKSVLTQGIKGWAKPPFIEETGFQGHVAAKLACPYCSTLITWGNSAVPRLVKLDMARQLLDHIETEHPNHPLTEPAGF